MSNEGWSNDISRWVALPSSGRGNDARLAEWRANFDEARAIARYVQRVAEGKGIPRRPPGSGKEAR
jgi:hypothetical protein